MSKQKKTRVIVQRVFFTSLLNLLIACGGGGTDTSSNTNGSSNNNSNNGTTTGTQLVLSGSVGDGPITGATLTIRDANGTIVTTTVSDSNANYRATVPDNGAFPYIISATSGIDMVTGAAPTFTMVSVVRRSSEPVANINPFSTLIVKTAQAMPGGLTSTNLDLANQNIIEQLNFGLDTTLISRPGSTTITTQNVAAIVKASETLAEMIRRAQAALQATGSTMSEDFIIGAIAADMTDGFLDGAGVSGAQPLVAAIANIVSGQVIIEALSNNLKVNGVWATDLLDNAIRISMPGTVATSADVRVTEEVLVQAKAAIAATQAIAPSAALTDVAAILENLFPDTTPATIETVLSPDSSGSLNDATTLAVSATTSQITSINTASNQKRKNTPPKVSLTAVPVTVAYNGTTTLSWTSTNAVSCSAIGGWTSTHAISGSVTAGPLTANITYSINCINVNSQITSASVSVTVGSPPPVVTDPAPVDSGSDPVPGGTGSVPTPTENEQLVISNINPNNYVWDTLELGKLMFVDRDYVFSEIPERYLGLAQIRTAKSAQDSMGDNFISFNVNIPVIVYVAHSDNIVTKPTWLQSWTDTGDELVGRSMFKKSYDAGTITLGGNTIDGVSGTGSMYMILIEPAPEGTPTSGSDPSDSGNNSAQNALLTLSWVPNPDEVTGYIVYFGPTADTANTQISDIPVITTGFNLQSPSIEYDIGSDLGLVGGNTVCFRVAAYNKAGLSSPSAPMCSTI